MQIRRTSFERDGIALACEYRPLSEGVKAITVNGHAYRSEVLSMTGFDALRLG